MGSYNSISDIVNDVVRFRSYGMTDDEIDQVLEDDGVDHSHRRSAFLRLIKH
jgi:hypothetical protein